MEVGTVINIVQAYYITSLCPYCDKKTSGATISKESERACRYCKQPYKVIIT